MTTAIAGNEGLLRQAAVYLIEAVDLLESQPESDTDAQGMASELVMHYASRVGSVCPSHKNYHSPVIALDAPEPLDLKRRLAGRIMLRGARYEQAG